jgi:hypothetical protein
VYVEIVGGMYNSDSCEGKKKWPWNYFGKELFVKENDDNNILI